MGPGLGLESRRKEVGVGRQGGRGPRLGPVDGEADREEDDRAQAVDHLPCVGATS